MSSFLVDLWEGIFTPGPTPTLLKATNISFAALQVVLFALLLATWSIHCVVLSVLCACLWGSVNWFATELYAEQARQREEERKRKREAISSGADGADDADDDHDKAGDDDDDEDTRGRSPAHDDGASETEVETAAATSSARIQPARAGADIKHRAPQAAATPPATTGTQSSASTEDEWEKVSETENDKDK